MAVLNSFQKLTRVLPGQPFGNGVDGDYSSATVPTIKYKSCSGTSGSTTLTADTDATPFSANDVVLIHQTRGTGAGQWEVNRISSVGSDQYTLQKTLNYTYTDSGASQAQVIKIPQYRNVTVQSGTWSITGWDGDVGGILPIAAKGTLTITGTASGDLAGYRGGVGGLTTHENGTQGESATAAGAQGTNAANGSGGGAGTDVHDNNEGGGGAGAGHGAAGSNGVDNGGSEKGLAGSTDGSADLTDLVLGAGGGGAAAAHNADKDGGAGGDGGGIAIFYANTVATITGEISLDAGNGADAEASGAGGGGGGGAGGACLIVCRTAALGTNKITVAAGSGGNAFNGITPPVGGAGGVGRIAVHHSGTVTGSTTPTFEDVSDPTLLESQGGFLINFT